MKETADAYIGLDNPTQDEWTAWHHAMLAERGRAKIDRTVYDDPTTAWSDATFRQLFLFMYDTSFWDRGYRTAELVERWRRRFGRIDEVLLWHAYPRLGFDSRTQFDFYRQMPGGLEGLRADVCDVLHAHGIRVLVDYNPWDAGTNSSLAEVELAEIVHALDADGVMLDTMTDVPADLARAVRARKRGVVFAPELRPALADLGHARQSWAQWCDIPDEPSIYKNRWLVPRHRQFAIARWDRSRKRDIAYSFFNGSGLVLWENVFGSYNPYSREDRRLLAETAAIFDHAGDLFAHGEWLPLVPTGVPGLDANRFTDAATGRAIVTLRNRTKDRLAYAVPDDAPPGLAYFAFWGDAHDVTIEPGGVQALLLDEPARAQRALEHFRDLSRRADTDDEPYPRPRLLAAPIVTRRTTKMIELPGGPFDMRIRHERRECGCYPLGATDDAMWGWNYKDTITHELHVLVEPFAIRRAAVTNAEFLDFVRASGYRPADEHRFLAHLAKDQDGSLPVTYVSLADARAYAAFHGERLPTEIEWQWAAEGAGLGHRFPGGKGEPGTTPQGVMGLSGNAWELTESEHTDGHTRFVMLRGGVFLPQGESEWLVTRGVRPNDSHAKYLLLSDGLDRSEAISFRTVSK